ncbi:hypothetical protein [Saccharopolyspora sp. NPDC002686]|uniref:hypothetical protein n=1 Tax=Saccharopolyspora sp. NPDC002686 TaxID=3154541 RepID=UPI003331A2E7
MTRWKYGNQVLPGVAPFHITVASYVPGADFDAWLYPHWVPAREEGVNIPDRITGDNEWHRQASAAALSRLQEVTVQHTATQLVVHVDAVELAINTEVAMPKKVGTPINAMVSGIVCLAPAMNSGIVTKDYLAARRDERIRADRERERARGREKLFGDHGLAWAWWADQRPDKLAVLSSAGFDAMLAKMDNARKQRDAEQLAEQDSFARILVEFIDTTSPAKHRALVGLFREYLTHFQRDDLVDRLDLLADSTSTDHQTEVAVSGEGSPVMGEHSTSSESADREAEVADVGDLRGDRSGD